MTDLLTGDQPVRPARGTERGDLRNLLQVAASALHLVGPRLREDLRPLALEGLAAIGQAAAAAPAAAEAPMTRFARAMP